MRADEVYRVGAPSRRKRWLVAALVAGATTLGATAWAQHGPHGFGGPGGGWRGGDAIVPWGASPEHAGRMVDRMLDGIGATDAQRAQVKRIMQAAMTDIAAQRASERALHTKAMAVFTAPAVDAAAAEALRAQMQVQHDQSSRRMLQAMLDVSNVLTPEQRAKLGARLQERQAIMHDRMQRMRADHPRADGPPPHGGPDHP